MANLYSHRENTPNRITYLKIEEASLPESRVPNSHQDCFFFKSKRHRYSTLESQTHNRITFSKIEEAPLSESQEPDSQQDCFLKNQRGTALRILKARLPTGLLSQKSKMHHSPNLESQVPDMIACSKTKRHRSLNFESQISLDKAYLQSSHATSAF
ncbi:hypothetical protein ACFX10_033877 [Malus domestica]